MSKIRICVLLIISFFVIIAAGPVWAQTRLPGVSEGNQFTYEVSSYWNSADPNSEIPPNVLEINMTEWYRVTITEVSGPDVSVHTTWRFSNETEVESDSKVNVQTGLSSGGFWAIIGANLRSNDRIHPLGPNQYTINQTITRTYLDKSRETNVLLLIFEYYDADDPSFNTTLTQYTSSYYDRQTGMLVELKDESIYTNPDRRAVISWEIIDTNAWDTQTTEFPWLLVLSIIFVSMISVVLLYILKNTRIRKNISNLLHLHFPLNFKNHLF